MSDNNNGQLRVQLTDEERIRIRDAMSDEERLELRKRFSDISTLRILSGTTDDMVRIEARLERIEKRLDELALKQ